MDIEREMLKEFDKFKDDPEFLAEEYFLDIAEKIATYMEKKNISRAELAKSMEVSRAYISQLFGDRRNMTLHTLAKISIALGINWKFRLRQRDVDSDTKGNASEIDRANELERI